MANISGYLETIRTANSGDSVRDAIIKCMKDINEDSAVRATNLTITKDDNVTYTAPKGYAFKNVTVNIDSEGETDPDKTYTYDELVVTEQTENKVYPDPDEHPGQNFAYSKVTVDINLDRLTGNITPEAVMTYTLDDPNVPGQKYWDCFEATGFTAVKRIIIDESAGINLPDYSGSGAQGGGGSADGPYIVTFAKADGKRIKSVSGVPKGSYVFVEYPDLLEELEASIPKNINGKPYSGMWRNADKPITSNITCTPIYNAASAVIGGDSLAKVMEDGGAHYSIGETILMTNNNPVDIPALEIEGYAAAVDANGPQILRTVSKHVPAGAFSVNMMLVAHGEGSTGSTWLAVEDCMSIVTNIYSNADFSYVNPNVQYTNTQIHATEYGCDDFMGCLSYRLLIKVIAYLLPEEVVPHLAVCQTKKQYGFTSGAFSIAQIRQKPNNYVTSNYRSTGLVWLPSYAELGSFSTSARENHRTSSNCTIDNDKGWELDDGVKSIDYTLNGWKPYGLDTASTQTKIYTRSTVIGHTNGFKDVWGLSLDIAPYTEGSTIQDRTSIGLYTGDRLYQNHYIGFCTT